jgi:hypothetical protein
LEISKLQGYNFSFLCLGGVAARNWRRKFEVKYGDSTISHKAEVLRKHKLRDPKGKEEEEEEEECRIGVTFSREWNYMSLKRSNGNGALH